MIEFDLFCDIKKYVKMSKAISGNMLSHKAKRMLYGAALGGGDNSDAVIMTLISSCNYEMTKRLVEYFDSEAPIQELLHKRLAELEGSEDRKEDIGSYLRGQKRKNTSFYQYLVTWMQKKGYETDADFYNHIGMSRQTFAKVKKHGVSRNHALLMAAGLGLNYAEAVDFLDNAGYTFRKDNRRDAIISYVMRNQKYTLYDMDDILVSFDEKTLASEK